MLAANERALLQTFIKRSTPNTPYRRRAQIVLLSEDGLSAEKIAAQVGVSITQTRNFARAFKRQGLNLFPPEVLSKPSLFSPDDPMAEAGRKIMAAQVEVVLAHEAAMREQADVTAVHETRKAIRRLRTAFRVFGPFYEPGALEPYRLRLKKMMRRFGRSRDAAILWHNLDLLIENGDFPTEARESLLALRDYWQEQKAQADDALRRYVGKKRYREFWEKFGRFTETEGMGVQPAESEALLRVRYHAPVLIWQRVAAMRAGGEKLEEVSPAELHQLRIQGKALRYTLRFFEPVLAPTASGPITVLQEMQEKLGEINDARVALELLAETAGQEEGVAIYRQVVEANWRRMMAELPAFWQRFDSFAWRQALAEAIAVL